MSPSIGSIAPSGRFLPVNSINSPALAPYSIAFASPSPRCHPAIALPLPRPFARHCHHRDRCRRPTRTVMGTGTAMAIAIGVIVAVFSIRTAATTDADLPAIDSAAAVRARCHPCRVGGPVSGVVVDNDAVTVDAPVRRHCRSRRRARRTQRPRQRRRLSTYRGGNCNGDGDSGNGSNGGDGDGNGGGGVRRMQWCRPPMPPGQLPPHPGERDPPPLDCRDNGGRPGGGGVRRPRRRRL